MLFVVLFTVKKQTNVTWFSFAWADLYVMAPDFGCDFTEVLENLDLGFYSGII